MNDLIIPKFQFEIRYTYILDFDSRYKSIMSPYLRFASGMQLHGQGTRNEYVKLLFDEHGYSIDCRWDRMVFVYEGDINNLKNPQSALKKFFFEIFDQISSLDSYGKTNNFLLVANGIKLTEDESFENIVGKFNDNYLNQNTFQHFDGNDKDTAIITEYIKDGISITQTFGPYNHSADLNKQNLIPFGEVIDTELNTKNGYMMQFKCFEETSNIDFEKATVLIEETDQVFQAYSEEVENL